MVAFLLASSEVWKYESWESWKRSVTACIVSSYLTSAEIFVNKISKTNTRLLRNFNTLSFTADFVLFGDVSEQQFPFLKVKNRTPLRAGWSVCWDLTREENIEWHLRRSGVEKISNYWTRSSQISGFVSCSKQSLICQWTGQIINFLNWISTGRNWRFISELNELRCVKKGTRK